MVEGYNLHKTAGRHRVPVSVSNSVVNSSPEVIKQSDKFDEKSLDKYEADLVSKQISNEKQEVLGNTAAKMERTSSANVAETKQEKAKKIEKKVNISVKSVPVTFTYTDSIAKEVTFHGSWSSRFYKMVLEGNTWKFRTRLKPGDYSYYFRADGVVKTNLGPLNSSGENVISVSPIN